MDSHPSSLGNLLLQLHQSPPNSNSLEGGWGEFERTNGSFYFPVVQDNDEAHMFITYILLLYLPEYPNAWRSLITNKASCSLHQVTRRKRRAIDVPSWEGDWEAMNDSYLRWQNVVCMVHMAHEIYLTYLSSTIARPASPTMFKWVFWTSHVHTLNY